MDGNAIIWQLICIGFVLLMTIPGLALYYGGLVRRKNVLSMMFQSFFLVALLSLGWATWGYSLAMADGSRFIGGLGYLFLSGCSISGDSIGSNAGQAAQRLTHMLFYGSICAFAGPLICGSIAERMKFTSLTIFMLLWMTLVFCPLCHWVWGGGLLDVDNADALLGGAADHSGGLVVHLSAGVSALVAAFVVGKRLGHSMDDMRPHNLTYTLVGSSLLWVGSTFMHAGHSFDAIAVNAMVHTHLSASSGAVAWAMFEWLRQGRASALGTVSGAIAGLVAAAPASGYVEPQWAIMSGALTAMACYFSCAALAKIRLYDDSLDVFGLHAISACVGLLFTAVLASVRPGTPGMVAGGGMRLLWAQVLAILIVVLWSGAVTILILKLVDLLIGLRVSQDAEMQGLDVAQHGQEGYIFNK